MTRLIGSEDHPDTVRPDSRTVYVVSFAPDFTGARSVGGFDWFYDRADAIGAMLEAIGDEINEGGVNVAFVAARVPIELDRDGITEYLDDNHENIDPPAGDCE